MHLQYAGESTWFPVHGQDVSVGGFAFYSEFDMQRGESVNVSIAEIAGVSVAATVRHVKPCGYGFIVGVEFDDLMPAELAAVLI